MLKNEELEEFEYKLSSLLQKSKIPSIALGIMEEGKMIYSKAIGSKFLKTNFPATTDTLYGIGSCTKSFTTLAILQLVEQGKLAIDDLVSKYIPLKIGLKDNPITIKHLMSHSSGLPSLGTATVLIQRISGDKETFIPMSSMEELLMHVNGAQEEIADIPGKRYFYNNSAFALLGYIIEKVSGEKYEDYIRNHILNPLEMNRTTFLKKDFDNDEDTMTAYFTDKNNKFRDTMHPFDALIYAAGGLLSSVSELGNYLDMCLNSGKYKDKQLIKPELFKLWWQPQIEATPGYFGKNHNALGWRITTDFFEETLIQHGGSTGVSSAMLSLIPKKKLGVIILGNVGDSQGGFITEYILAMLLGKNPKKDLPALRLENKLNKFVGEYQTYKGISKFSISKPGLTLLGKYDDSPNFSIPIIPESDEIDDFNFYIPMGNIKFPVYFEENTETGQIDFYYERTRFHKIGPLKDQKK